MCYINFGEDYGKMVVIVDMVDMNRVLVDGIGKFPRVIYPLKRLNLTRLRIPVLRGARTGTLAKAAKAFDLEGKWKNTPAARKFDKQTKRASLTDFDRFKVMVLRKQRSYTASHLNSKAPAKGKGKPAAGEKKKAKK